MLQLVAVSPHCMFAGLCSLWFMTNVCPMLVHFCSSFAHACSVFRGRLHCIFAVYCLSMAARMKKSLFKSSSECISFPILWLKQLFVGTAENRSRNPLPKASFHKVFTMEVHFGSTIH